MARLFPLLMDTNLMSPEDFERERSRIREDHGDGARWEQELARLYEGSGWTQREIAKFETAAGRKVSQSYVDYLLRFARFLTTNGGQDLSLLKERTFRGLWRSVEGEEAERFARVAEMYANGEKPPRARPIRPRIGGAGFCDGKWHPLEEIVAAVGEPPEKVKDTLDHFSQGGGRMEKKQVGSSWSYRLFPKEKEPISRVELKTKFGPLIKEFRASVDGKNAATIPIAGLVAIAARMKKALDELAG